MRPGQAVKTGLAAFASAVFVSAVEIICALVVGAAIRHSARGGQFTSGGTAIVWVAGYVGLVFAALHTMVAFVAIWGLAVTLCPNAKFIKWLPWLARRLAPDGPPDESTMVWGIVYLVTWIGNVVLLVLLFTQGSGAAKS